MTLRSVIYIIVFINEKIKYLYRNLTAYLGLGMFFLDFLFNGKYNETYQNVLERVETLIEYLNVMRNDAMCN